MKFGFLAAILMVGILLCMSSCDHEHGPDTHTHGDDSHDHGAQNDHGHTHAADGAELEPINLTRWTSKSELFVQFTPLIVGRPSQFEMHFTDMISFKPVPQGEVQLRLRDRTTPLEENRVAKPSSPGIFQPVITPDQSGKYSLDIILKTQQYSDTIIISGVVVYDSENAAMNANHHHPKEEEVVFTKEQAWKTDFAVASVERQPIREVIHTSGEILSSKGEEKIVAAKSSGMIYFKSKNLQEGRNVRNGETLFTISSKGLFKSNLEEKFEVATARVDRTKADFERSEKLLQDQIIGLKEYEKRKMDFAIAKAELKTLSNSFSINGQSVSASMTGIVKKVMVSDGQYVEEGTPLVSLTNNRRLILQAEVSQSYLPKLHRVQTVNFKTSYQEEVQSIKDYNGRMVSYGKIIDAQSRFLPVQFELDNLHDLIPGSYVELFLLTNQIGDELVIPKSAILQDYGTDYVFVQLGGERFEKREVKKGVNDGINVQILSGLEEKERVVTKGAYQIKMASMSSTIPSHGHAH